uniref:Polypeptide N-acetylgalactosaminyltransferase n=2 Tax=Meloidogyne incognita group TaxID=654580 RepID=A0A914N4J8_MELIC
MSLRRRWFEFKRIINKQPFSLLIFLISVIGFIFFISSGNNKLDSLNNGDKDFQKINKKVHQKSISVEKYSENSGELPGSRDPDTIFKDGIIGNFEQIPVVFPPDDVNAPGEEGKPIMTDLNSAEVQKAISEFGFNTFASDKTRLNRSIPDVRIEECKYWHYPEDLPSASVVIAFHNEGWSPLLRTVHSVLLRSPAHLLKEVILVDDASDKEHLKTKLDEYIKQFNGKVILVRNKEREGLINTRTIGAKASSADVVIFLDAHCEVNRNWLPPLLAPIRKNRKVMTVPVIDGIDMNTWEYKRVYGEANRHFRGIFEWGLLYKEIALPDREKKHRQKDSEPFRSPTHAGGLFAIDKNWFEKLGYYDPGLQIWGGEQYELSFKIWQCGGGILFVPCSHVGHVYRHHMPYNFGKLSGKPVISTNLLRVIKTWMDDYGKYYFIREPNALYRQPGDISKQLALRDQLKCKSFQWFMDNVAYDVFNDFPLPPPNDVWGEAKNHASDKCIDTMGKGSSGVIGATPCHGYGGNQLVKLNTKGQMTQGEWCLTPSSGWGGRIHSGYCPKGKVDGPFSYNRETKQIRVASSDSCLTADKEKDSSLLILRKCDSANAYQKWEWTEKYS